LLRFHKSWVPNLSSPKATVGLARIIKVKRPRS